MIFARTLLIHVRLKFLPKNFNLKKENISINSLFSKYMCAYTDFLKRFKTICHTAALFLQILQLILKSGKHSKIYWPFFITVSSNTIESANQNAKHKQHYLFPVTSQHSLSIIPTHASQVLKHTENPQGRDENKLLELQHNSMLNKIRPYFM